MSSMAAVLLGGMPRKSYKPEEIVAKLRQVDVLTTQGKNAAEAIRSIGVSEVTYYRWRQEFGGLKRRPGEAAEGPGNGEHPVASCGVGSDTRQADIAGGISGKLLIFRVPCLRGTRSASLDAAQDPAWSR